MKAEEFMKLQKELLDNLKQKYSDVFGEQAPDLSDAAFWGSEVDLLEDAINTGVPINIKELSEQAVL